LRFLYADGVADVSTGEQRTVLSRPASFHSLSDNPKQG
jgi:hypothetical protein